MVWRNTKCPYWKEKEILLPCHASTGCDTVSAIMGHGKSPLLDKLCSGNVDDHLDVSMDTEASKNDVIHAGICLFKYIYNIPSTSSLAQARFNQFSKKAAAGVISPETSPPTEGAAAQHSFRAYLQTRD